MNVDALADVLIINWGRPNWSELLLLLHKQLDLALIHQLKERSDQAKLRQVRQMLQIAHVTEAVAQRIGSPEALALAALTMGNAFQAQAAYGSALSHYHRAAKLFVQTNDTPGLTRVLISQIGPLQEQGAFAEALALADQAETLCAACGHNATFYRGVLEQNRSAIYLHTHAYPEALAAAERGQAWLIAAGEHERAAHLDQNIALALEGLHQIAAASERLKRARAVFAAAQCDEELARFDLNLGVLAARCGRYAEALQLLEQAEAVFDEANIANEVAFVQLMRAQIYHTLNLQTDALTLAAAAVKPLQQAGMNGQVALAYLVQAQCLGQSTSPDRVNRADALLQRARRMVASQGAIAAGRLLEIDLARLALVATAGPRRLATRRLGRLRKHPLLERYPTLKAQLSLLALRIELQRPDPNFTRLHQQLGALHAEAVRDLRHEAELEINDLLSQVALATADQAAALTYTLDALRVIERLRALIRFDEPMIGFVERYRPLYERAVALAHHHRSAAFTLALLSLAATAPLPRPQRLLRTSPELDALREQWHHCQSSPLTEVATPQTQQQGTALLHLEVAIADHWRRIQLQALDPDPELPAAPEAVLDPATASAWSEQLQARLRPSEAMIHVYIVHDHTYALVLRPTGPPQRITLAPARMIERTCQAWRMQIYVQIYACASATSPSQAQWLGNQLYTGLIAPLEPWLTGATRLLLTLPAAWHDLPVAALWDGQHYLVETRTLGILSSPATLPAVVPSARPDSHALTVGCSDGGRLPGALREAQHVAEQLATQWTTTLLLDDAATEARVSAAAATSQIIHVATHAVFRPENPLFSWLQLADARITVANLYQFAFQHRPLILLSACETGRGSPRGGGVLGMARGLLVAGAASVVVSLWRIADVHSVQLMTDVVATLRTNCTQLDAAAALCTAQRYAISQGLHPFAWAGWIAVLG